MVCKQEIGKYGFTDRRSHEESCPIYLSDAQLEGVMEEFIGFYDEDGNDITEIVIESIPIEEEI